MNKKIPFTQAIRMHLRATQLIKQENPGLFLALLLSAVISAVTPYVGIYLSALLINELAGGREPARLWTLVLITLCATAAMALLNAVLMRRKNYKYDLFWMAHQKIYANKMLNMDFSVLDDQHTHDLRSQISQNDNWSSWGLGRVPGYFEGLVNSCTSILGAIALTVSLFQLPVPESAGAYTVLNQPLFVMGVAGLLLLTNLLAPLCSTKANSIWSKIADNAKLGNRIFSYLGLISYGEPKRAPDIRIYQQQVLTHHYLSSETMDSDVNLFIDVSFYKGSYGLLNALAAAISVVSTGIVYVYVCLKAWAGAFGVGSVTQYVGAITTLTRGVASMFETLGSMRSNASFLTTTYEFLDIPNAMYQGSLTTEKRADRRYEIEFRDVSFRYPHTDAWALRHVSVKFRVGSRLAVVGENGSGKTTFIKLLCRLYDPQEGQILLNGIDIRKYDYRDYMRIFSVAFQDFQLLAQPLGANVAGSCHYDRERVNQCLHDAGFEDRSARMTKGLDTYLYRQLETDGVEVSGGEAQEIAIARALYKDAPFIILDEPTAALDPIAEAEIYAKFDGIAGDRTAICISHRLSSCKLCDHILVFDHGQIVQQGNHEQLLQGGKYAALWGAQAQYYTEHEEAVEA